MLIGIDAFSNELVFEKEVRHLRYDRLEMYEMIVKQIYVDTQAHEPNETTEPDYWRYSTVLNAKFNNNMEAGSVEANNMLIESIKFQKRKSSDLEWQDVAEMPYDRDERIFYETMDKFIASGEIYQYAIVPSTSDVDGVRVISEEVTAEFEGVFLSNKEDNYELLYNLDLTSIENNLSNATFIPLNSKFPVVVSGTTDYTSFGVSALFISADGVDDVGNLNLRMERARKENLLTFLKDGKPKVYRDGHGRLKLVMVVGSPTENPSKVKGGISDFSVNFVEIGGMDADTLKAANLQETLVEVL